MCPGSQKEVALLAARPPVLVKEGQQILIIGNRRIRENEGIAREKSEMAMKKTAQELLKDNNAVTRSAPGRYMGKTRAALERT